MKLRAELMPPALNEEKFQRLAPLADEIVSLLDSGEDYDLQIKLFNKIASRPYSIADFDAVAGYMSSEEFAKFALTPDPPYIANLTRQEQLELIRRVGFSEFGQYEEHEIRFWLELLRRNLSVPHLEFSPNQTPEQVLQNALAYKPIQL